MKRSSVLMSLLLLAATAHSQFSTTMQVSYAQPVGDSFEIYVSLPPSYNAARTYNVVYYCDANLKSGKALRQLISTPQFNEQLQHSIFVGIGHIGNYHVLRRRDYILPFIKGTDTVGQSKNYGQIENFYTYLKADLIPSINQRFKTNPDSNAIIGHSLGGLFAFYCLFKADNLFAKHFALSPALWIDKYAIYQFNKMQPNTGNKRYIYFTAGSKETLNKILKGANAAKEFLDAQQYQGLIYEYEVWQGKTHNSAVQGTLERILKEKL